MPDKKILAGGVMLAGVAFWFYVKPHFLDAKPAPVATEAQIAAAPRPTVFLGRTPGEGTKPPEDKGVILNLKSQAGAQANYAKVVIALEFEDPKHKYVGLSGAALDAKNLAFAEELKPEMHKVMDVITDAFGGRTVEQVGSPEGRDKLKADLITVINKELHGEKVTAIYFSTFITQ
jgi:hypothetical protein